MVTPQQVLEELKKVKYPGFARDIVSFGMVKDIEVGSHGVNVMLAPTTAREEIVQQIRAAVVATVAQMPGVPAVDSRNDYVNHMDPFDGPVRILNLATCGQAVGDDLALGGILCHWPDVNAGDPMNIYRQSPVFPAVLAAAERYWHGRTPQQTQF